MATAALDERVAAAVLPKFTRALALTTIPNESGAVHREQAVPDELVLASSRCRRDVVAVA